MTITGTNLAGATVLFAPAEIAAVTSNTATSLVVTVPAGAVTGLVSVTTAAGTVSTLFSVEIAGQYADAYRYNRASNPTLGGLTGMAATLPFLYDNSGTVVGSIAGGYNASTGRYATRSFSLTWATAANLGGIIGALGTDDTTIASNTLALTTAIATAASTGGRLRVLAGTIVNQFTVPNQPTRQAARAWLVIEAVDAAGNPFPVAAGARAGLAHVANCFTVRTRDSDNRGDDWLPAGIEAANGASFIRIIGARAVLSGSFAASRRASMGALLGTVTKNQFADGSAWQSDSQWIILDRCLVDGRSTPTALHRGAVMWGRFMAVIGCSFIEIGTNATNVDSHCLFFRDFGPLLIENNFFSAEHEAECIIVGGSPLTLASEVPVDIMVIDNQFRSSLQRGFSVKTHLELKYGDRVLVEGNDFATGTTLTFQHYITFKLAANGSDPLQIRMENVVIRANVADGLACMIGLQARDADSVTAPEPPRRFIVEQNISQHPADLVAARAINNGTIPQQTYAYALYKQLVTHHNTLFGPASNVDVFTLSGNRDFGNQLPGGDARVD
ncbi:MAG: hypothetical protein MUF30_11845, partial [Burkholderiales bacterium]|nr:hypothetical protein [Burkholderiales bacterium]